MIAAIRIRGEQGVRADVREALEALRLRRKHVCVLLNETPEVLGQLRKCKDFITWGLVNDETIKMLEPRKESTDGKAYYRLHPPRGGFERKGIKKAFPEGGVLGNRASKINELIAKMV